MARTPIVKACLFAGAALALVAPGPAFAQSSAELAERVRQLEAALSELQGELRAVQAREAQQDAEIIRVQQAPTAPVAATPPTDGFRVGATTFRLGGYVKAEALYSDYSGGDIANGVGRDFFVPAAIPVGGLSEEAALDMHAKQTRLTLTATRAVDGHTLSAYVEADFQSSPGTGNENVTNAYNFAIRRATISYDRWLFGQDWTTFQNVGALPETTDFIGPSDGTVFARQALVRYTQPLGEHLSLAIAAENPETTAYSILAPTIAAYDDDALPDVVARLNWSPGRHQFTLAAIGRQLAVDDAGVSREATGWGVSASGRVAIGARDDLRFMLSTGEGIGRYMGIGFAPDAAFDGAELDPIGVTGGFAAYRHAWSDRLRSTVSYSFLEVDNDSTLTPSSANDASSSWAANLFFTPTPGLDLGVEYRHAERELFGGASGEMDRIHLAAKQSF